MSQGGGRRCGVTVVRALGSAVASEDAWLAGLAHGRAPFISLLARRPEAQMSGAVGLRGFGRRKRCLPLDPACSRLQGDLLLVCCFLLCASSQGK